MKKRLISLVLVLLMLLSTVPVAAAANPSFNNFKTVNTYEQGQFADVAEDAWYAENIRKAYELGLVKGSSETQFNPDGNITLAETLALASRLHSIYTGKGGEFQQGNPWYKVYVDYAAENGLMDGIAFKSYTALATREQFAFLFARALPAKALPAINKIEDGQIPDVSISTPGGKAIYTLYNAGILTGSDEYGTFHPINNISRAEVATMVIRMADKSMRVKFAPTEKPVLPTDKELSVLPSLISSMTKCKAAVDNLCSFWDKEIVKGTPAPTSECTQAIYSLTEVKAMLDDMVAKYNGYEYYAALVKQLQVQSEDINNYFNLPNLNATPSALHHPVYIIVASSHINQTRLLIDNGLEFLNAITLFS